VSGGADSDVIVHIIAKHFRKYIPKIHFVFANTGIEYRATLQHLKDLEQKYDIKIEEVKGMPIPLAVKKYGVPFVSKQASEYLSRLQKHHFGWEDGELNSLLQKYPKCKVGLRYWTNDWGDMSRFNIAWNKRLKEFLMDNKPEEKFSAQCCIVSKKAPLMKYQNQIGADLYITGERKSEGGTRAGRHSSCFENSHGIDHFMPLWFWNDATKEWYCNHEGIEHSDCYKVYGLKRTGCVGCPFAKNVFEELEVMQKYEPQCYKLCMNVFGESYHLTEQYREFKDSKGVNA
jgi:3'-phosphoadenosine 5'-phosphosulfate sulfotransferase (PAPS reductase)/FAD synthetase